MTKFLIKISQVYLFIKHVFIGMFSPPFEFKEVKKQAFFLGTNSLLIIGFSSFIVGIVFTRQSRGPLAELGAEAFIPGLVAIAIVRSLGPLVTGLIACGKIGASIGAELSAMNISEQIDAMEVSGTRPFQYLVVSRVIATSIVLPILVMYANTLALLGGFVAVNLYTSTSLQLYISQVFESLRYLDLISTILKPLLFGMAIGITSSFLGYHAERSTEGTGRATTSSVVISMIIIFILDFLVLQVISVIEDA